MSTRISPDRSGTLPPLALIAGPTASGKSAAAVRLAQKLEKRGKRAVIVNADSAQVYADLAVLSARPAPAEMGGIEHRLFGTWDGVMACSAADWAAAAKHEITALQGDGSVPIMVGGTGLYLRTLLDGIAPVPAIDPEVRAAVRALPVAEAYAALIIEDPARAKELAPADAARIARSLEVVRSTGRALAEWQHEKAGGIGDAAAISAAVILPPRPALYERCETRFAAMIDHGAADEVEALLARGLDPALPVMRAIGVPEIAAWLDGSASREVTLARGSQATRNYAKRQYTWFGHQTPSNWHRSESNDINFAAVFASLFHD